MNIGHTKGKFLVFLKTKGDTDGSKFAKCKEILEETLAENDLTVGLELDSDYWVSS
jgi:hypothetical protein